jgi:lipoprotein-anchoring transpeptidase ErfK/SrfK
MVRHMILGVAVIICAVIMVAAILFVGLDIAYANRVFKGVSVEGINIGSLDRQAAVDKLRSELDMQALNSDLTLSFDGHTWPLPLYEIDAYVDLEATVDKAMSAAKEIPFYERWGRRAAFMGVDCDVSLVVHYDPYKLNSFVSKLVQTINRPPVNAEIRLEGGRLVFQRSQDGWILDEDQAWESIISSLTSTNRVAELRIEVTPPQVSDNQVGKVITVDKSNHILTLYNNMEIEKQYPIAVGMPSWPTPSGTFSIVAKTKNPTWVNPGSSWAATMPPFIPPGPGNPLGTRALATSASGVFIHGTYSSWSIGESVSHGCIRMYIKDSEDIFERVQVGTPVLIF